MMGLFASVNLRMPDCKQTQKILALSLVHGRLLYQYIPWELLHHI